MALNPADRAGWFDLLTRWMRAKEVAHEYDGVIVVGMF